MRFFFIAALSALMAIPAQAETVLSDLDRATLRAEIKAYLFENPEIIEDVLDLLAEREAEAERAADADLVAGNKALILDDGFSYAAGPENADLTLVEFIDYQCGYCKRAHPDVKAILAADPSIRYVIKELPILGQGSMAAGRAALAVLAGEGPDKYAAFSDALMSHQGQLSPALITAMASDLGINTDEMAKRAQSDEITDQLNATRQLAQTLQLSGTPTFVVGDVILRGYLPREEFESLLQEQRAQP